MSPWFIAPNRHDVGSNHTHASFPQFFVKIEKCFVVLRCLVNHTGPGAIPGVS
jgi:hypothetical protein